MVLYANANVAIFAVLGCTQLVLVVSYQHLGKNLSVKGQTVQGELDQWVVLKHW